MPDSKTAETGGAISWAAWRILGLSVVMQALTVGSTTYCFTLLVQPWMRDFELDRAAVMTVISLHLLAIGAWSVPAGKLIDRYPSKVIVPGALLVMALGWLMVAGAPGLTVIALAYVLVLPIGVTAAGSLGAMSLVARNFTSRRGMAMGISTMGTSIGGIFLPLAVAGFLPENGWRATTGWIAVVVAVLAPLAYLVLRHDRAAAIDRSDGAKPIGWRHFLGQRNFWVIVAAYLLAWMTFTSLQNNLGPYATDIAVSPQDTGMVMSVFAFSMVCGKLVTGFLSDRIENRLLFVAASTLVAAASLILYAVPSLAGMLVAFGIMGIGTGAYLPLKGAMLATYFGPQVVGRVMGLMAPFVTLFAVGPLLASAVRDHTSSYAPVFVAAAVFAIVTIPVIMFLRLPKADNPAAPPA